MRFLLAILGLALIFGSQCADAAPWRLVPLVLGLLLLIGCVGDTSEEEERDA